MEIANIGSPQDIEVYCLEQLFYYVPQIKSLKDELGAKFKHFIGSDTPAVNIYGGILTPFLINILKKPTSKNSLLIDNIMILLEKLLLHPDWQVNICAESVIDYLVCEYPLNYLENFLLPKSLEVAKNNRIFTFLYKHAFEELFKRVPEIEHLEGELGEYVDDIKLNCLGPYIIYESVLVPYLIQLIKNPTGQNKEIISRILQLIEDFSQHENEEIRNLITVGVMETLLDKLDPVSDVEKWLLPNSLKIAQEVGSSMFGFDYRNGWKKRGL